ncbi:MAG TPA: thioredoxin-dependent thiol peroxidase [Bacteroidetes bacterium]|nr:thioredoxin-dependent thiol peroxidase [Bacteroidota bacterium]
MVKLKTGDRAPDFSGTDQNGNTVHLGDYRGNRLVLYFYPKDHTPGCTAEACNLRDNYEDLMNRGFRIIGVSPDSTASHQKFSTKHRLPFPLVSDTGKSIMKAYGAWGEKSMFGKKYMGVLRKTFIISEDGIIEQIFDKVNTRDHTRQILETLEK